jgi:hypothetical protein
MSASQEKLPLLPRDDQRMGQPVKVFGGACASKAKGSSVARIAQDFERRAVEQRPPVDLAFVRAGPHPVGKEHPLRAKKLHGGRGRANAFEGRKQQSHSSLNLGVRIKDDCVLFCVGQPNR